MRRLLITSLLLSTPVHADASAQSPDGLYKIRRGDTLIELAQRGLRRRADFAIVQRYNGIRNARLLRPDSILRIPDRILKTQPLEAKVAAFRGGATIDGSRAVVGLAVREGAVLRTGPDTFLSVALADGSLMTLPSRSTMKVVDLHRIVLTGSEVKRFDLIEGRSETEVQKAERTSNRFEIHTPVSVAAVRGTRFRVTFANGRIAGTSVLEGTVGVGARDRVIPIAKGQGIVASTGGLGVPVPLLSKPSLDQPDKLQDEDLVSFKVAPVPGAASYRIQLAADAGFVETFAESTTPGGVFSFADVPNGSFFARATALSPNEIEGFPSVYSFERRRNSITAKVGKADDCPGRRCLRFRWRAGGEGERRYRFQLTDSSGAMPMVDEPEMTRDEIVITDLPAGTYHWRVESTLLESGRRQSKWTDYQELQVAPLKR